eukprot:TRINITY_DN2215_c0_g1_i2.p1 TRINITY_DN2215_c0_g1~~TRINITY_DN2215_c0_g1_i2.p1  ORF type:complete len:261 (+),score=70.82 TRINITY_DN2215_c0_g1_i2:119-901(+)
MKFYHEWESYFSWNFMLKVFGFYFLMVVVLQKYMAPRKRWEVKGMTQVYNLIQIVLCSYMTYGLAYTPIKHLLEADYSRTSPLEILVNCFANPVHSAHVEKFMMIHYFSKILDFVDTFVILVKKDSRRLSALHLFHHSTIFLVWGWNGQQNALSIESVAFGALYNSFIHVLMYSHYLVTSFGISNPFKKVVTQMQIFQFYVQFSHAAFVMYMDAHPLGWLQFLYTLIMIAMFSHFYQTTYTTAAPNQTQSLEARKEVKAQ